MLGPSLRTQKKLEYPHPPWDYVTLYFLNKINVIKVIKALLELFKLDIHSRTIQEHFILYIYLCL